MLARHGEQMPSVVIIVGDSQETLRLFGETHAVGLVRTALFSAAVSWSPLQLDENLLRRRRVRWSGRRDCLAKNTSHTKVRLPEPVRDHGSI
jgi:hypothetical protein